MDMIADSSQAIPLHVKRPKLAIVRSGSAMHRSCTPCGQNISPCHASPTPSRLARLVLTASMRVQVDARTIIADIGD